MDERVRIDKIRLRELSLPFRTPFQISSGTLLRRRSWIVEIESDGCVGYGESAPNDEPYYSEETIGTVRSVLGDLLIPRVAGREFSSIDEFDAELRRGVRGNPFARVGLENAYWDLCCRRSGVPLVDAIGSRLERLGVAAEHRTPAASIESGVSVGIPPEANTTTLARWIEEYLDEGYRRVKIKMRPDCAGSLCKTARDVVGEGFPLWTDANASFELSRDLETLQSLDEFGLLFHEQPLHHRDLIDHATLGRSLSTPVCLDESLHSERDGRAAIALEASRIWNIKIQRVGGLSEALRIYRLAVKNDVALWGGTMPESGVGAAPMLALGAFPGFVHAADIEASDRWYEPGHDPIDIEMSSDGRIDVPREAGVEPYLHRERYESFSRIDLEA